MTAVCSFFGFALFAYQAVFLLSGDFVSDILQKIHAGRVAAAYRMCYDEVQNFKRSDEF